MGVVNLGMHDMPLLHCDKCHHEWEGKPDSKCAWCKESGFILEQETSLERWAREWIENHKSQQH